MARFHIDWFRTETIGEFGELSRYYQLVKSQLDEASRLELYAIKAQPTPQDRDAYQETIDAHRYKFEETLPRMLMYSLMSRLYAVVEYRLDGIVKKKTGVTSPEKKKMGNLAKRTDYFLTHANLSSLLENEKQNLNDFIFVRNCIVHDAGFVEGSRKESELIRLIKENPDELSLDWEGRIVVSKTYWTENLDAFLAMFQRLFAALNFGPETMTRVEADS